jgi:imidazolonepropionase-like amidohydrolase
MHAQIIDGTGQTLLPGLFDAHTHSGDGAELRTALICGITTELDMGNVNRPIQTLKERLEVDHSPVLADLRSSGCPALVPGGHGTEYAIDPPTITEPEEAAAFVERCIAEGSDYIKIMYDDMRTADMQMPMLKKETMAAVVKEAHRHGKLTLVHCYAFQYARDAIEVGVDGLAHMFVDQDLDTDFIARMKAQGSFVIPTFTALDLLHGQPPQDETLDIARKDIALHRQALASHWAKMPRLKNIPADAHQHQPASGNNGARKAQYITAEANLQRLRAEGVPVLAGTDASPFALHGIGLHRELELLVQAGLTPLEALTAATSTPARLFQLQDRGKIAPGLRADLVLINGDPTEDIKATRAIAGVWKRGMPVQRPGEVPAVAVLSGRA